VKYWLRRNDSLLDWLVWQVMRYVARRRIRETRRKLTAVAVIAALIAAAFLAARRT